MATPEETTQLLHALDGAVLVASAVPNAPPAYEPATTQTSSPVGAPVPLRMILNVMLSRSTVAPADGVTFSVLTATVTDYQGTGVPPGTAVTFETIVGRFSNGSTSITVTTTGITGTAVVHFFAPVGTTPQLVQITAMSMGVSARAVVEVTAP